MEYALPILTNCHFAFKAIYNVLKIELNKLYIIADRLH